MVRWISRSKHRLIIIRGGEAVQQKKGEKRFLRPYARSHKAAQSINELNNFVFVAV